MCYRVQLQLTAPAAVACCNNSRVTHITISPAQELLATQQTNIHTLRGIRTRNPGNEAASELCLRPHGHRCWQRTRSAVKRQGRRRFCYDSKPTRKPSIPASVGQGEVSHRTLAKRNAVELNARGTSCSAAKTVRMSFKLRTIKNSSYVNHKTKMYYTYRI